jgi:outer membrane immunogenic protein
MKAHRRSCYIYGARSRFSPLLRFRRFPASKGEYGARRKKRGKPTMRKSLFCSAAAASLFLGLSFSAEAADLPPAPPPPQAPVFVAPPPFSWTGFYLGGNLGAGWNHGNISDSAGLFTWGTNNSTTFVGGAQVGVNYQISNVVLGVEGDFDWFANNNNSGAGTAIPGGAAAGSVVQGSIMAGG